MKATFQKTKIVATVGPAIDNYETLKKLILTGVNVFRLNFSHGKHDNLARVIKTIHQLNDELGTYVSILADLQGPVVMRLGLVEELPRLGEAGRVRGEQEILGLAAETIPLLDQRADPRPDAGIGRGGPLRHGPDLDGAP